jgi:hypothetical protein
VAHVCHDIAALAMHAVALAGAYRARRLSARLSRINRKGQFDMSKHNENEVTYSERPDGTIVRSDGVVVSTNPNHSDREAYEAWLEAGNKPTKDDGKAKPHDDKADDANAPKRR